VARLLVSMVLNETPAGDLRTQAEWMVGRAYTGHREHRDRSIVNASIGRS
jgi:hypothetical protein